jgi:hypothetical protein
MLSFPRLGAQSGLDPAAAPVADPVKYVPWTIGQNYAEIQALKKKDPTFTSQWQANVEKTYGYDLSKDLEKLEKSTGLVKVRALGQFVDADFFAMTRFSDVLNGVDGSIVQVVNLKVATTNKADQVTTDYLPTMVEGWVVGTDGKAAGMDMHGTTKTLSLNSTTDKSITMTATFEVGAGLYDKGKITGNRGDKLGSIPGVYDIFKTADTDLVKWLGDPTKNTKYTVTFTFNADGTWTWKDPTANIDLSGKFGTINPK